MKQFGFFGFTGKLRSDLTQNRRHLLNVFSYCFTISIVNDVFFTWLFINNLNYHVTHPLWKYTVLYQFVEAVIIAPVIETLIFQYAPVYAMRKMRIRSRIVLLGVPTIWFAFAHQFIAGFMEWQLLFPVLH